MRDPEGLGRITRCDQEEKKTCLCEFLVLFKDVLDLSDKFVEPEFLVGTTPSTRGVSSIHLQTAPRERDGTGRTLRAETMCSGLMVFFESFSQISLASDETVKRNSEYSVRVSARVSEAERVRVRTFAAVDHEILDFFRRGESGWEEFCVR